MYFYPIQSEMYMHIFDSYGSLQTINVNNMLNECNQKQPKSFPLHTLKHKEFVLLQTL